MSKRELLLKKIKENNGIITTREALNLGIHKPVLLAEKYQYMTKKERYLILSKIRTE